MTSPATAQEMLPCDAFFRILHREFNTFATQPWPLPRTVQGQRKYSAAVSAMLDRLLHHGHVLKCGPRSWRTKLDPPGAAGRVRTTRLLLASSDL